jgi:hypothetical protein
MAGNKARVSIIDQTSGKKWSVILPTNVPVSELRAALVRQLGLTTEGPNGAPLRWDLVLETETVSIWMEEEQTLADVGVQDGAVLRLGPQGPFWPPGDWVRRFPPDLRLTLSDYTPVFLGTAADNDCCLPSVESSGLQPHHALIVAVGGLRFAIVSREGEVAVNGERVRLVRFFEPGSNLSLGSVTYRFDVYVVEEAHDGSRTYSVRLRLNA